MGAGRRLLRGDRIGAVVTAAHDLRFFRGFLVALPPCLAFWLLVVLAVHAAPAHAQEVVYNAADSAVAIAEAADLYGVPESRLWRVARCEAPGVEPGTVDPYAVGDSGHSFGLAQLNDRRTGLLAHFHSLGYGSAF